jgi:hypothetical protein
METLMPTDAQLEANRANSQKSTGPRTPEGKARSAQNACDHGLCASQLVVRPGQEAEFEEMQTVLYEEILPVGGLEDELFKALVHAAWNQRRCRQAEADLQVRASEKGLDILLDPALEADLRRVDLYGRRAASAFHRNLKAIRDLQTERFARQAIKETCPEAKTTGLGLARLPAIRHAALHEQTQYTRASRNLVEAELQAYELKRRRLEDELAAAQAA